MFEMNGRKVPLVNGMVAGKLDFNKKAIESWQRQMSRLSESLAVLIHWTYGSPARGEELVIAQTENSANGLRSLYVMHQRLCVILRYSKTSGMTGKDKPILRALPAELSNLMVMVLAYIRPLESILAYNMLQPQCDVQTIRLNVFQRSGKPITGSKMGDLLREHSMAQWGDNFGLAEWRQLVAFVQDHFGAERRLRETLTDAAVSSFSHGGSVHASWYAVDDDRLGGHAPQAMAREAAASVAWHAIVGLGNAKVEGLHGEVLGLAPADVKEGKKTGSENRVDLSAWLGGGKRMQMSTVEEFEVGPEWLSGLQKLGFEKFKSPKQAQAVELVHRNKMDGFIILETGGGKTLLATLPLWRMNAGSVIVWAVPSRALRSTLPEIMKSHLSALDVGAEVWVWDANGEMPSVGGVTKGVMIVMVESLLSGSFLRWAEDMRSGNRLVSG